jgi:HD-GYP domain-containing protein (c-di-GMP phosphodiesterase class II)
MLGLPVDILAHAGPLSDPQRRIVEGHARTGGELAHRLLGGEAWLADAVAAHHERVDGTGYPAGLRGPDIPDLARLLAVADVYSALCEVRPYRLAKDTRMALAETLVLAEQGLLDTRHAGRLLDLSFYPVGTAVELADGDVGVVVAIHRHLDERQAPARPVIVVLTDQVGQPLPTPHHVDLAACESQSIVRSLSAGERRLLLGRNYPEFAS